MYLRVDVFIVKYGSEIKVYLNELEPYSSGKIAPSMQGCSPEYPFLDNYVNNISNIIIYLLNNGSDICNKRRLPISSMVAGKNKNKNKNKTRKNKNKPIMIKHKKNNKNTKNNKTKKHKK